MFISYYSDKSILLEIIDSEVANLSNASIKFVNECLK
jgi:hypothetical protein